MIVAQWHLGGGGGVFCEGAGLGMPDLTSLTDDIIGQNMFTRNCNNYTGLCAKQSKLYSYYSDISALRI